MKVQKGDQFRITNTNQKYEVVGRWGEEIVLASVSMDKDDCLIYSQGEIEELIDSNMLITTRRYVK